MLSSLIIAKKEIKTTLRSPSLYFIACLMCCLVSYMSFQLIRSLILQIDMATRMGQGSSEINLHQGYVAQLIYVIHFFMILFIPALTSFSFAEEKKSRTLDLLLTSPILSIDIVLGKYIASLFMVLILIAISFLYTVPLHMASPIDWPLWVSSYIGLYLVCAIYVSIGIFASSLSSSAIVSFVIALVINLFCIFILMGNQTIEQESVRLAIDYISISKRMLEFIQGNVQLTGIVFLISMNALFVALTHRVIESARWR